MPYSHYTHSSPQLVPDLNVQCTKLVTEVNLNYVADMVQVKFDPTRVTSEDIRIIVKKLGEVKGNGERSNLRHVRG